MNKAPQEAKDIQVLILKRLEAVESMLNKQEEAIKAYKLQNPSNFNAHELLTAGLKSTRTSFELLRDEIEEFHQLVLTSANKG